MILYGRKKDNEAKKIISEPSSPYLFFEIFLAI